VRDLFPGDPLAERAFAPLTLLFRLDGPGAAPLAADPAFAPAALDDIVALAASGDVVWGASHRGRRLLPLRGTGSAETLSEEPRGVSFGPAGERVVVTRSWVRVGDAEPLRLAVPAGRGGERATLDRIASAALGRSGLFVADERRGGIHRFDRSGNWLGRFPDERERPATRLVADQEGALWVLDTERRTIEAFDEWGRPVPWSREALPLRRPVDLAVDAFRNVYVADEEAGLLVFSGDGRLRFTLAGEELRRPVAVAVAPSGVAYVFDERSRRVLSYR
jgi:DNA-binding beta-propeller fold protein YncE